MRNPVAHAMLIASNVDRAIDELLAKEAPGQAFDESKHPRDEHGRFGQGNGSSAPAPSVKTPGASGISGWKTAGKIALGVAAAGAAGAAAYYGGRYLLAHKDEIGARVARAYGRTLDAASGGYGAVRHDVTGSFK